MTATDRYNYAAFRSKHFVIETVKTLAGVGVQPGRPAPDFTLPMVGGGTFRLSEHRDRPLILRFGSYT